MPSASHTVSAVRPELDAEVDHGLVVLDRRLPHRRRRAGAASRTCRRPRRRRWSTGCPGTCSSSWRRTRARVGVSAQPAAASPGSSHGTCRLIGAVGAGEGVERGDVVDLLLGGARARRRGGTGRTACHRCPRPTTAPRPENRATSSITRLDVDAGAADHVERVGRGRARARPARSFSSAMRAVDRHVVLLRTRHRRNATATPPSTGMIRPVVRDSSPPTSANTAAATCSGSTSLPSSVRPA